MCLCMGIVRTVVPSVAIRIFNEIVDVFSSGCHKSTSENLYELSMENDSIQGVLSGGFLRKPNLN